MDRQQGNGDRATSDPAADDLGVSDLEYERILRDLRRRGYVEPEPSVPSGPDSPFETAAGVRRSPRRWLAAVLIGALVAVVLTSWPGAGGEDGPGYAFMETVGGRPVTYSSCRPVQVAVYPAGGPSDAERLVREAVDRVRDATGLDVRVVGAFAGHAPNWNFQAGPVHPDDPISISWQDGEAIAELSDHVVGLGGSRVMTTPYGGKRLVAGTIALSRDYYAELAAQGDHDQEVAVLLHELGHVFGLAHVKSHTQLMSADGSGVYDYAPGDLEGLRLLGQGPC